MPETDSLLVVNNLKKHFPTGSGGILSRKKSLIKAVDGVSFSITRGKTLGLVGESGCGKSTTGRTILRLYKPTDGDVLFDGEDISSTSQKNLFPLPQKNADDFSGSLCLSEFPHDSHRHNRRGNDDAQYIYKGKEKQERIFDLLNRVGLKREHANRYPHEFSGGQRQRVGIARALAVEPELIICDEPISALDVSIQAQVVNMLEDLQNEMKLTYLFIAHDLSMVKHISDRIAVMYLGMLTETADSDELYRNPQHPYTKALLSAIPYPDPKITRQKKRIVLEGDVPSPVDPPGGCRFASRCPLNKGGENDICQTVTPELVERDSGHFVACHKV